MEFGWDEAKCKANLAKHGLDFSDVFPAFFDTAKVVVEDIRANYGEVRYNMLAKLHGRICNITFTERGEVVWLISARKANQREQTRYAKL
ncbi:MAG: BrnT family toxin [Beijerinckiaceae bacterium]